MNKKSLLMMMVLVLSMGWVTVHADDFDDEIKTIEKQEPGDTIAQDVTPPAPPEPAKPADMNAPAAPAEPAKPEAKKKEFHAEHKKKKAEMKAHKKAVHHDKVEKKKGKKKHKKKG